MDLTADDIGQPPVGVGDPRLDRLLAAMRAAEAGDFRKRVVVTGDDVVAEICAVFNGIAERNRGFRGGSGAGVRGGGW